eukprot:227613-Rhodomonas_salina.2
MCIRDRGSGANRLSLPPPSSLPSSLPLPLPLPLPLALALALAAGGCLGCGSLFVSLGVGRAGGRTSCR